MVEDIEEVSWWHMNTHTHTHTCRSQYTWRQIDSLEDTLQQRMFSLFSCTQIQACSVIRGDGTATLVWPNQSSYIYIYINIVNTYRLSRTCLWKFCQLIKRKWTLFWYAPTIYPTSPKAAKSLGVTNESANWKLAKWTCTQV